MEKAQERKIINNYDNVMYDIKDMMNIIGCCRKTIMTYIKSGKLKAVMIGGKWKISKENLESFCNGK